MEGPMESLVRLLLTTLEFQIMKLWQHVLRALLRNEGLPVWRRLLIGLGIPGNSVQSMWLGHCLTALT
jgi:hypothetical protein